MWCIVGQKRAVDKMLVTSQQKLKSECVSQTVAIELPKVDRGLLDSKNNLGTILDIKNGV